MNRFQKTSGTSLCFRAATLGCACVVITVPALAGDPPAKRKSPFADYNLSRPRALEDVATKDSGSIGFGSKNDNWREDVVTRINAAIRAQVTVEGGKIKYDEAVVVDLGGYYTKDQILRLQKELNSAGWQVWRVKGSNVQGGINTIYLTTVEKD